MRRIMSSPSYNTQRNTKKTIISPWDRTLQAMLGGTSNNVANSNGGYTHYFHHNNTTHGINGNNGYNNSNTNNSSTHRRSIIERIAIISMLMIAWGWIMTFCGMLFYHGYQYRMSSGDRKSTRLNSSHSIASRMPSSA